MYMLCDKENIYEIENNINIDSNFVVALVSI